MGTLENDEVLSLNCESMRMWALLRLVFSSTGVALASVVVGGLAALARLCLINSSKSLLLSGISLRFLKI